MLSSYQAGTPKLFPMWGVVVLIVCMIGLLILTQSVGVSLFSAQLITDPSLSSYERNIQGSLNGTVMSYAMILAFIVILATVFVIVKWRIHSIKISAKPSAHSGLNTTDLTVLNYLAIKPISMRLLVKYIGIWAGFAVLTEWLNYYLHKMPTAFMDDLYDSAQPVWLLIIVVVVIVPIYEELIFRGIAWTAIVEQAKRKRTGIILASISTSIIFAVIHSQYGWYEMSIIVVLALIMSAARAQSGSLLLPIMIHMVNNMSAIMLYALTK